MAAAGKSFLPFQPSYLTGTSPLGGPYGPGYVSPETAQKMVDYIATLGFPGAKISEGPCYGLPDQTSPGEVRITLTNGQEFDANGLLDEFAKYGPDYVKQLLAPNTKQLLSSMRGPTESFIPPQMFGV